MIEKDEKKKKPPLRFKNPLDTYELEELEELGIYFDEDELDD